MFSHHTSQTVHSRDAPLCVLSERHHCAAPCLRTAVRLHAGATPASLIVCCCREAAMALAVLCGRAGCLHAAAMFLHAHNGAALRVQHACIVNQELMSRARKASRPGRHQADGSHLVGRPPDSSTYCDIECGFLQHLWVRDHAHHGVVGFGSHGILIKNPCV